MKHASIVVYDDNKCDIYFTIDRDYSEDDNATLLSFLNNTVLEAKNNSTRHNMSVTEYSRLLYDNEMRKEPEEDEFSFVFDKSYLDLDQNASDLASELNDCANVYICDYRRDAEPFVFLSDTAIGNTYKEYIDSIEHTEE